MTRWRRALVADRRRGRRGARGGVRRTLVRVRHQERRVLHALHVPDPGRRGGGQRRRGGGRCRLLDAERGTPAAAPLVARACAPQGAYPAVGAGVAVGTGDAAATRRCPYAADHRWHTDENTRTRYTGPGLHFHEAGLIAAPRCVRLLLHLEEARRGQVGMVMVLVLVRAAR